MKSKVICILNKESIVLLEKYFNLSDYDLVCFDHVSGQKVIDLNYDIIDMSLNFPSKLGFVSGSSFTQIISYFRNKNIFNFVLNNYSEVNFTFENVYVRMFCLNSKIKSTILFSGTIHDERYSLKMIKNFSFRNLKLHILYFFISQISLFFVYRGRINIMLNNYFPILLFIIVSIIIGALPIIASRIINKGEKNKAKSSAYECGFENFSDARMKFDIRFYLVAILFIIFDLEIAFLFPWAVALDSLGLSGLIAMSIFLIVLVIGFIYEWKKGALNWD